MLVRFSSPKTESIIMFGDAAVQLIRMLGGSGNLPGAVAAADMPAAIQSLRQALRGSAAANIESDQGARTGESRADDDDLEDREAPISLSTRAEPLLDILERARAADAPVMWESLAR